MSQGISFAKSLLEAFLTGFAIAAGVSLFVVPMTSRKVVHKEIADYIAAVRGCLKVNTVYMHTLEHTDMFSVPSETDDDVEGKGKEATPQKAERTEIQLSAEAKGLKDAIAGLGALHSKLHVDLGFAKKEIAYGNLKAEDISEIFGLLRNIFLPIVGMGTTTDIFASMAESRNWQSWTPEQGHENLAEYGNVEKEQEIRQWNEIMTSLHGPFESLTQAIDEGLQHILYMLQLAKLPKARLLKTRSDDTASPIDEDVEAKGASPQPGQIGFVACLARRADDFYQQREVGLKTWCKLKGNDLQSDMISDSVQPKPIAGVEDGGSILHHRNQQQLYLVLYVSSLFSWLLASTRTKVGAESCIISAPLSGPGEVCIARLYISIACYQMDCGAVLSVGMRELDKYRSCRGSVEIQLTLLT